MQPCLRLRAGVHRRHDLALRRDGRHARGGDRRATGCPTKGRRWRGRSRRRHAPCRRERRTTDRPGWWTAADPATTFGPKCVPGHQPQSRVRPHRVRDAERGIGVEGVTGTEHHGQIAGVEAVEPAGDVGERPDPVGSPRPHLTLERSHRPREVAPVSPATPGRTGIGDDEEVHRRRVGAVVRDLSHPRQLVRGAALSIQPVVQARLAPPVVADRRDRVLDPP